MNWWSIRVACAQFQHGSVLRRQGAKKPTVTKLTIVHLLHLRPVTAVTSATSPCIPASPACACSKPRGGGPKTRVPSRPFSRDSYRKTFAAERGLLRLHSPGPAALPHLPRIKQKKAPTRYRTSLPAP